MLPDRIPDCGPLGGVLSALRADMGSSIFIATCDMPLITPELIMHVLAAGDPRRVCLAADSDGRMLLFGLIPASVAPHIDSMLASGERRVSVVLGGTDPLLVDCGDFEDELTNINTPAQYRQLRSARGRPGSSARS